MAWPAILQRFERPELAHRLVPLAIDERTFTGSLTGGTKLTLDDVSLGGRMKRPKFDVKLGVGAASLWRVTGRQSPVVGDARSHRPDH